MSFPDEFCGSVDNGGIFEKVTIGDTPICFTEPYTHGKEGSDFLVKKVKICPILSGVLGIATKKEQSPYQLGFHSRM